MGNMGYCRFENTLADLGDCADHLYDDLVGSEKRARRELMELARQMVSDFDWEGDEADDQL